MNRVGCDTIQRPPKSSKPMTTLETVDFELVEPRYIRIRFHGEMDGDSMEALMDAMHVAVGDEPFFLLEADVREVKGVSPEARRIAAERFLKLPDRAIAMVGGGFAQKIFAKLVLTAVSMLRPNPRNAQDFFQDPDRAREWLKEYSDKYQSQ